MGKSISTSLLSKLSPQAFGAFTRNSLLEALTTLADKAPDAAVVVAATCLASLDPNGPNPGSNMIVTAADVLANAGTPVATDILWQAAEHAVNWRVRTEAIRRSGPAALTPERRQALRTWAADGFSPGASFQNDQFSTDSPKVAAITAL